MLEAGGCRPIQGDIDLPAIQGPVAAFPSKTGFAFRNVDQFSLERMERSSSPTRCVRPLNKVFFLVGPVHFQSCRIDVHDFGEACAFGHCFRVCQVSIPGKSVMPSSRSRSSRRLTAEKSCSHREMGESSKRLR